ncbi:histidine phosphatase family protein [Kitasatospora sp. NPDC085879]|jgi:phosphohistidine phosphatase|uniref:SixA phosphatase family protein n=1 Tax=Kitasatospora sp. NPDC085879 TaxID=3154769 RepID=UPI000BB12088|nr:histidine phosphatase family protein [Streptomyces sp. TLI_235]PBC77166.1 phosphohistidine phosphatase [Streptomyces sp. TLI_235]
MSADTPRRIIVLRHAKADWPNQVADHERPLADRGRHQAPEAGRWLTDSGINPDYVLCSTALRTRETWKLAAHELPKRPRRTVYEDRVYEASPGEIIAVLQETPDEFADLILVGHNPGVLGLTQVLAGDEGDVDALNRLRLSSFPTAAIAVLSFAGPWKSVEPGVAKLDSYHTPQD